MARGTQLLALITMLRDELGRSNSVAVGVADLPRLRGAINRAYASLVAAHDWPHLRRTFAKIPLSSGQYHYDLPADLDYDRIELARVWWNNIPHPIARGISLDHYAAYNTTAGTRSSPASRWDIRNVSGTEQIEVWPIPVDNEQDLQFIGIIRAPKLVENSDRCLLDDDLVVLFAAARLIKDPDERGLIMGEAKNKFNELKANSHSADETIQIGLGSDDRYDIRDRVILRVS